MNTLQAIAAACWHGASNPVGVFHALGDAMRLRIGPLSDADKLDLRIILDHLDTILPRLAMSDRVFNLEERYAAESKAA